MCTNECSGRCVGDQPTTVPYKSALFLAIALQQFVSENDVPEEDSLSLECLLAQLAKIVHRAKSAIMHGTSPAAMEDLRAYESREETDEELTEQEERGRLLQEHLQQRAEMISDLPWALSEITPISISPWVWSELHDVTMPAHAAYLMRYIIQES